MQFQADQVFAGRYRLLAKIGIGGFSEVWRVADEMAEDQEMVLKIYAPERGLDEHGIKLFRREYSITAPLNHTSLLKASHFDISDGSPYLIMPYCSGGSLYGKIMEAGTLSEHVVAEILVQVCGGLQHLHDRGIIHQDIKPDNVLIDGDGNYLLTDFGISSRLRSTMQKSTTMPRAMTVAYSPPEKFKGTADVGPAGDVFSLGVMIYELLTGNLPWSGMGGAYLMPNSEMPSIGDRFAPGLQQLLDACLAYDPANRPTAAEVGNKAHQFLTTSTWGNTATTATTPLRTGRETMLMDPKPTPPPVIEQPAPTTIPKNEPTQKSSGAPVQKTNKKIWAIATVTLVLLLVAFFAWINTDNKGEKEVVDSLLPPPTKKERSVTPTPTIDDTISKMVSEPPRSDSVPTTTTTTPKATEEIQEPQPPAAVESPISAPRTYKLSHRYESARRFQEGLAAVEYNDKWGFINKKGEEVIPTEYDWVQYFNEGLVVAKKDNKWGVLNKKGEVVVPFKYEGMYYLYKNGWIAVKLNGKWGYIDGSGKVVIDIKYDMYNAFNEDVFAMELNGKWGAINKDQETVIPFKYDNYDAFKEGLGGFVLNGKYGYLDKTGKTVIDFQYEDGEYFYFGLAGVRKNYKWGFINHDGELVIDHLYDKVFDFKDGLAAVMLNKKWGFIDTKGNVVIPFQYSYTHGFENGNAPVQKNGKWASINKKGQAITGFKYDSWFFFKDGLAPVSLNGKHGFIDQKEKQVIPLKYDDLVNFSEGLAAAKLNGEWMYIDKHGNEILKY